MEQLPFTILLLALILAVVVILRKLDKRSGVSEEMKNFAQVREADRAALSMLQQQLGELTRQIDSRLTESRRDVSEAVHRQFSESQKLLSDINTQMTDRLVAVAKEQMRANEAVEHFAQIGDQLANLERTLTHQKQRGNWGEASLALILQNILPPDAYKMQYPLTDKDIVDAVIITKDGMIPIDAKFSLDNYQRVTLEEDETRREELEKEFRNDLKKRIDETAKYVNEKAGTLSFAFMYIPAEAIYYDLLVNEVGKIKSNTRSLLDYAYHEKKVIIVSPTTFSAYLQAVLFGYNAFKIEKDAVEIIKRVEELGRHIKAYEEFYKKLGGSLSTTVSHYNSAYKELGKIDKDVKRIAGSAPGIEATLLDKPVMEEE
ncbi:MAG TPA: DNA recombination protein RmuC [Candidatus Paceibacterota bacterium]|nr:DNA recombination protein RmuC [Candidatus Paceibacterota bacterium]